jgi:hypothetical protein
MRYISGTWEAAMKRNFDLLARRNVKLAKEKWFDQFGKRDPQILRSLTKNNGFALALGDLLLLEGRWYVTHTGLLRLAARSHCHGIHVQQVRNFCDPAAGRWVFKASVYKCLVRKGSLVMATPILPIPLPWFAALRCVSPKHAPLIEPCGKLTELASALSRS